jgi:hypothetical protein
MIRTSLQHVVAFGHAVRLFEREKLLDEQDRTGKWKCRRSAIGVSLRRGEPDFAPDPATMPLVDFLIRSAGSQGERAWYHRTFIGTLCSRNRIPDVSRSFCG